MRFVCVHCNHTLDAETAPARCPSCLRASGMIAASVAPAASVRRPVSRSAIVAVLAVLGLAGGVTAVVLRRGEGEVAQDEPASAGELRGAFSARGIDAGSYADLFASTPEVTRWATALIGEATKPRDKARALVAAVRARAAKQAFVPWSLAEVRQGPFLPPTALTVALAKDGGQRQLYPLELAVACVAGLRALDVPALVGELPKLPGSAPLDPSGYLGYFVVRVRDDDGALYAFDPWGGRELPTDTRIEPVSDVAAVSAAFAIDALEQIAFHVDTERALRLSSDALAFAGSMPSVRTTRGVVVLGAGMPEQALQELEAARQLRDDAPRMHNVASAYLLLGELPRAQELVQRALADAPDLAAAHATNAVVQTFSGDAEAGARELALAESLAPASTSVQLALAEHEFAEGQRDQALTRATRAVDARPAFDALLRLAVLQRHAARHADMQATVARLLAMTPAYRKDEIRELLTGALGPSAFDAPAPDDTTDQPAPSAPERTNDSFQLRAPTLSPQKLGGRPSRLSD